MRENAGVKVGGILAVVVLGVTLLGAGASTATILGACCLPDGSCVDTLDETACNAQGGDYQGESMLCADVDCPQECGDSLSPACDGDCPDGEDCVQAVIDEAGGALVVDLCECRVVEGACCWPSGECTMQTEQSCVDGGATYQGDGSDCANVDCPRLCGGSYPECDGDCPEDEVCVPDMMNPATGGGAQFINQCKCVAPDGSGHPKRGEPPFQS